MVQIKRVKAEDLRKNDFCFTWREADRIESLLISGKALDSLRTVTTRKIVSLNGHSTTKHSQRLIFKFVSLWANCVHLKFSIQSNQEIPLLIH